MIGKKRNSVYKNTPVHIYNNIIKWKNIIVDFDNNIDNLYNLATAENINSVIIDIDDMFNAQDKFMNAYNIIVNKYDAILYCRAYDENTDKTLAQQECTKIVDTHPVKQKQM
jgi:hypothetical protein